MWCHNPSHLEVGSREYGDYGTYLWDEGFLGSAGQYSRVNLSTCTSIKKILRFMWTPVWQQVLSEASLFLLFRWSKSYVACSVLQGQQDLGLQLSTVCASHKNRRMRWKGDRSQAQEHATPKYHAKEKQWPRSKQKTKSSRWCRTYCHNFQRTRTGTKRTPKLFRPWQIVADQIDIGIMIIFSTTLPAVFKEPSSLRNLPRVRNWVLDASKKS